MKRLLILSVSLNLLFILFFIGKRWYYSYGPGKGIGLTLTPDQFRNMLTKEKAALYNAMPVDSNDIVFVGTSITEAFPLAEMFGSANIKNRGISGNTSTDILNRIDGIIKGRPRKIFIEMGINDFIKKQPIASVYANYTILVNRIKEASPGTTIYIQSLLPTSGEYAPCYPMVVEFNERLKGLCDIKKIAFIDLFTTFNDGKYTYDGVHPNAAGYGVWHNIVRKYL